MMTMRPRRTTVLAILRDLIPRRALSYREAERLAELQANRLRELLGVMQAKLADEVLETFPRVAVRREANLPVSGLTYWDRGWWTIVLNSGEPAGRRRFSLAHEFKHILDHTTKQWLYQDHPYLRAEEQAERIADYFAGCLLMPKRHVKRLFGERMSLVRMADALGVTPRAMHVRLSQLGLVEPNPRCGWSRRTSQEPTMYRAQEARAA